MTWLSDETLQHLGEVAAASGVSGRYELLDVLGRGGMGTVYRAYDGNLGREVALKVLEPPASGDFAARLLREAQVLARLEHPGIVPVHDAGTLPDGRAYYAMKRVRGTRLDQEVRSGRPLPELLRIFERLCEAVAFAHAQGVLHRDLKPENVMVGPFGEVLVMDWGVARVPAEPAAGRADVGHGVRASGATAHGTVLGTPGYMAPEQARGEVERLDARADVYSLGAVLYFLLTGRAPAAGASDTGASTRTGHGPGGSTEGDILPPRRFMAGLSPRLEAVAMKALAFEPAGRYASVEELSADVTRFLANEPVSAYREGLLQRAARLFAKHRTAVLLVLAYLVMRVAFLLFSTR